MNSLVKHIIFLPAGSLDMDSSPETIASKEGMYSNCLNVSKISLTTKGDNRLYPVNGNLLAITPPTIAAQNKIYQVQFSDITVGAYYQLQFNNLNGSAFNPACLVAYLVAMGDTLATITSTLVSYIQSSLNLGGFTYSVTSPQAGTILIEITSKAGFDYILEDLSTPAGLFTFTVIQEAWDSSLAGLCYETGSEDWLDDFFLTTSSVGSDPISYTIAGTGNVSGIGSYITIQVAGNITGTLKAGYYVNIAGVEGTTEANGQWYVSAISYSSPNTTITLYNSTYANAYVGGGIITTFINGFFNISVSQYDIDTSTWTTYNLLSTKEINSRYIHPYRGIDADEANQVINLYLTDNNDVPRIFSYTGAYMNNGAIQYYNPEGLYTYEDVADLTDEMITINPPLVAVTAVSDVGGAKESGNWRYTVTLSDSNNNTTGAAIFSNPVNLYNGNYGIPSQILGTPGSKTSMAVTITVSEIPAGFSFVNLIGINYAGSAEVAYLIKTVPIPPDTTTMTIVDTGLESGIQNYGGSFTLPSLAYVKAGTQCISNNTLLYGNLTAAAQYNFTAISQILTHVLQTNKTALAPLGDDVTGYTLGEYQIPVNTHNYTGYMLNETYRFWACYELVSGVFTPLFWIDDIRFDLNSTNLANPFNNNRRTANNITSYDLSESVGSQSAATVNSYVFYLTFSATGLSDYLIDGIPFGQLVKRIHIFRTDNIQEGKNEVLACGLMVRHCLGTSTVVVSPSEELYGYPNGGAANYIFDNPYPCTKGQTSNDFGGILPNLSLSLPSNIDNVNSYSNLFGSSPSFQYGINAFGNGITPSSNTSWAHSFSFYSPDLIYGQTTIGFESGNDYFFSHGQPNFEFNNGYMDFTSLMTLPPSGSVLYPGTELRLSGATDISSDDWHSGNNNPVQFAQFIGDFGGNLGGLPNGLTYCSGHLFTNSGSPQIWDTPHHYVIYCQNVISQNNSSVNLADIGFYYGQYYRNLGSVTAYTSGQSKFGAINTGTGIPTGAYIDVTSNDSSVDVFGGDTFTQKAFLKVQYSTQPGLGAGCTCVIICQNRMNFNMRNPGVLAYPQGPPIDGWINDYNGAGFVEEDNYDAGYTPRNIDNTLSAFNPAIPNETYYPDRKIFSLPKPQGSVINNYRTFLPLSFNDDQTNKGNITALVVIDEELYVLQPKAFWRHYYNDVGTFQGEGTGDVSLGSAAPFSKPPTLVSNNGCSNIFSVIRGKHLDGSDVVGWIDIINKKIMLFSKGSLRDLTLEHGMRTWFEDNLSVDLQDVPILQNSISGVFDEKRKEFIWTVYNVITGVKQWNVGVQYVDGDRVYFGTSFEGINEVWEAVGTPVKGISPSITNTGWKYITQTYTIAYSLLSNGGKGGFTMFLTPAPYFYGKWKNTYLSAYPNITNNAFNGMYVADKGDILTWYLYNSSSQQENGYFEYVVNELSGIMKVFQSVQVSSLIAPYQVNFNTRDQESYVNSFREVVNLWLAAIPNDMTNTPPSGSWNGKLYGGYCVVGTYFEPETEQYINNFANKFRVFLPNVLT